MAKRRKQASSQPILRKVYFYRIAHCEDVLGVLPGEIQRVMNLPFDEIGRYSVDADGNRFALWPESAEYPLKLKFGRTRLSNLPTIEGAGKISPLDLAVGEGLLELCHIIVYSDGFVAAEFNFEGPRMTRLSEYLFEKRQALKEKVTFLPLFEPNILALVEALTTVKLLELKGQPVAESLIAQADRDLANAFGAMVRLGGTETVAIELSGHSSPASMLRTLVKKLAELAKRQPNLAKEGIKTLRIRGLNERGQIDFVDLLEDHLVSVRQFDRLQSDSKAIDSEIAFDQIHTAYLERKDDLPTAVAGKGFFE